MSEVTVGRAAKVAGVPVEVLQNLCEAGKVTARRGERGHWYLTAEDIPSAAWVVEAVRAQYREEVANAQESMAQFTSEVEAVQLDLNEAAEDVTGRGRLGNDLASLTSAGGPFDRAHHNVIRRLLDVQLTHRRLQALAEQSAHDASR